ncbi:NADPH2:quinone reductase [Albidovulum inexpectatum]|uniref:NADPH2:quinone reductase n=1 Tax=Albidovulum inexpectatum TaxID=196587 RepID=A0A2S5JFP7_9RHOB|nr:NADPH:quinone oxidoreductase family protein [Albidovulum inexpectatum]PPB80250.1 NADPH2:quinone reductase [Albidovulum inexpectatum]
MKAFQITRFGETPALRDVPSPEPGPGEVRIRIAACGLNFADLLMIEGRYQERPEPPVTLGMEPAGWIDKLGPGVGGLTPGQRVVVHAPSGGLAEYGCFPADRCLPLPDEMSFEDAAAFQVAYGTSHLALTHRAGLKRGETLLVLGAAGGVGLTAVEIGKRLGARVIAVARGADKLSVACDAGADHLIDSESEDLRDAVRTLGGADVVYDPVGGTQFDSALRATRPEGRILVIGFASGTVPQIPANLLLVKNLSVLGFYWGGYLRFAPQALTQSLRQLLDWYREGGIRPHVSNLMPLERTQEALELLRSRKSTGKVVIQVAPAE